MKMKHDGAVGVLFLDTEEERLPRDEDGHAFFDADLCDWDDGRGPMVSMIVPSYETGDGVYGGSLGGMGVIEAPIEELLEHYLGTIIDTDGGDAAPAFVAWLRAYADRLEHTVRAATAEQPDAPRAAEQPVEQPR